MPSLKNYRYDGNKEVDGVWFETPEGLKLKIARINNPLAAQMTRKLGVENQRRLRRQNVGDLINELAKRVAAKYILLDWKDLEDDDGVAITYSHEKALEFFMEYDEFYLEICEYAGRDDEFREEITEAGIKNS